MFAVIISKMAGDKDSVTIVPV